MESASPTLTIFHQIISYAIVGYVCGGFLLEKSRDNVGRWIGRFGIASAVFLLMCYGQFTTLQLTSPKEEITNVQRDSTQRTSERISSHGDSCKGSRGGSGSSGEQYPEVEVAGRPSGRGD